MIDKIQVEYLTVLTEKLGTGPLETVVYRGGYGPITSCVKRCINTDTESGKNKPRKVLLKKIETKLMKNDIDWESLQTLEHPCVARYILVHDKFKVFQPKVVYIIQDYCQFTLSAFIKKIDQIKNGVDTVLKNAVRQMASGLKYLHDKKIVHGNLKPSNVLVKPTLLQPKGFVLTDYAYTDFRSYPQKTICCWYQPEQVPDDPNITRWMAPELLHDSTEEVWTNKMSENDSDGSIMELQEGQHASTNPSNFKYRSMADIFSFGKILEAMFEKVDALDEVDRILCKLMVEQMTTSNPNCRISCSDILERHPFVIVQPRTNSEGIAMARLDYIKELFDRFKKNMTWRQKIERDVNPVTRKFFPWSEPSHSFGDRIFVEMNNSSQVKKKYDSNSFMDLLRLIRNTKEHPHEGKKLKRIKDEVADDAFSKDFPFVLPLIYVCVECAETSKQMINYLSDIYTDH